MAKSGFGKFKWNRSGYVEVENSSGVQSRLRRYADSSCGGANAYVNAQGESGTHYATDTVQGRFAHGYIVHTLTYEGMEHAADALGRYG